MCHSLWRLQYVFTLDSAFHGLQKHGIAYSSLCRKGPSPFREDGVHGDNGWHCRLRQRLRARYGRCGTGNGKASFRILYCACIGVTRKFIRYIRRRIVGSVPFVLCMKSLMETIVLYTSSWYWVKIRCHNYWILSDAFNVVTQARILSEVYQVLTQPLSSVCLATQFVVEQDFKNLFVWLPHIWN